MFYSQGNYILYHKKILQWIFQFGRVNSRNLRPLKELITKAIEQTSSFVFLLIEGENFRQAFEDTEPRTSELVNLVFSRQTGIQSASIRFRSINRSGHNRSMSWLYKAHGYILSLRSKLYRSKKQHMLSIDRTRLMQHESCSSMTKSSKRRKGFAYRVYVNTNLYSDSWCESKMFHPIRTCVSHHLWTLILSPFLWILNSLRVQRFLSLSLIRFNITFYHCAKIYFNK